MRKSILKNIILVIISPRVGWEDINKSSIPTPILLSMGYFPLLAILAISCFAPLIYDSTYLLNWAILKAVISFASFFVSYFLCAYLLGGLYPRLISTTAAKGRLDDYIIYNLIFLVLLDTIKHLIKAEFAPLYFLVFYLVVMANKGLPYLELPKDKENNFLLASSALLIGLPLAISFLLNLIIIH